ncbi:nuclease-related domain-containing protein [Actinomadura nitritigenes]|uniref:nuclease-related domain-containing protein n=1 Tax=Actinomadura nitritigenes TaxID=134602 RepID=UPI003D8B1900
MVRGFLVEIKSHQGRLVNSGSTWMFHHQGRVSTIENPLHLVDRKAKELKEQLQWALRKTNTKGLKVPFIQAAVFLSDPALRSELDSRAPVSTPAPLRTGCLPFGTTCSAGAVPSRLLALSSRSPARCRT